MDRLLNTLRVNQERREAETLASLRAQVAELREALKSQMTVSVRMMKRLSLNERDIGAFTSHALAALEVSGEATNAELQQVYRAGREQWNPALKADGGVK